MIKTKIKLLLLIVLCTPIGVNAYNESISYDWYSLVHYIYNSKSYYIKVPDDINELDNKYMHWTCDHYCNLIQTNHMLIKLWLEPIY